MLAEAAPALAPAVPAITVNIETAALKEYVWAVQNGHTALRLSQLVAIAAGAAAGFPPHLEKMIVVDGKPEITKEVARRMIAEAGIVL